ncbi:GL18268 [Drosophila persimilis]|uniref:GL18268 n=1 Tax=Drosophila persimilis TaxID=7234 RepID=B4H4Q0_DROPE|nr:GL18268 [Drosophila persimilis]
MCRILCVSLLLWHFLLVCQFENSAAAAFSARQSRNDLEIDNQQTSAAPVSPAPTGATETSTVTSGLLKKCLPCTGVKCVPQIQCPAHVRMKSHEKPQICDLPAGKFGYCCQTGQNHTAPRLESRERRADFPSFVSPTLLDEARRNFEHLMHGVAQIPVHRGLPDFSHGIVFHSTAKEDLHNFGLSHNALEQVFTTQLFSKMEQLPVDDIITNNVPIKFTKTPLDQHCQAPPICRNIQSPGRIGGAAGQPLERMLPPAYEDGIWNPRVHSTDGTLLLGARKISRILLADVDRPHPKYNLLVMQFGQVLAHDVSQTSTVRLDGGDLVQCCSPGGKGPLNPQQTHFACMPISVDPDDEFYNAFGVRCLNLVRLSLVPNRDCQLSYGKQMSKVTHFLDVSPVYGSSQEAARDLRSLKGGRLRMLDDFGRDLLPLADDKKACASEEAGKSCFKSVIIGPQQMKRFRLVPLHQGYAHDYSPDVNPAITNEFSGAAYRMGHSSVDGKFHIRGEHGRIDEVINIPDVMFNPSRMRKREFYDNMLRTLYSQPIQQIDSSITQGLSRFLFRGDNPFGLDLAAINIQRGRDQGLHCYNDYLELMGAPKIKTFDQFPHEVGQKLARAYRTPDDIDLWVGGLLEKAVEGGIVGVTFAEIIADQFARFKHGDRYYYEYDADINPGAFTPNQLQEIRKTTMARLICDNADRLTLQGVPVAAFIRADFPGNQMIGCDDPSLPAVNLNAWRT